MNDQTQNSQYTGKSLLELDLFDLLKLSHLSEEVKAQRTKEIENIVYSTIFTQDLPEMLSKEDFDKFLSMMEEQAKDNTYPLFEETEVLKFIKTKIPDWDQFLMLKFLAFKKELVRDNMQKRMDLVQKELGVLKNMENKEERGKRMDILMKEHELLDKILKLIDQDSWDSIADLISTLPL